jgi:hypothetical protein
MLDVECLVVGSGKTVPWYWLWCYLLCGNSSVLHFIVDLPISKTTNNDSFLILKQVPVYIAEITPKNLRGQFTSAYQV